VAIFVIREEESIKMCTLLLSNFIKNNIWQILEGCFGYENERRDELGTKRPSKGVPSIGKSKIDGSLPMNLNQRGTFDCPPTAIET
jgi:hypothetical protein